MRRLPATLPLIAAALAPLPLAAEIVLPPELPLGRIGLAETREVTELAPGVTHARIERGAAEALPDALVEAGPFLDPEEAAALARGLDVAARVEGATETADDGAALYMVRSAAPSDRAGAEEAAEAFEPAGGGAVRALSDTGAPVDGPFVVNVLRLDLGALDGEVDLVLARGEAPGAATVLEMAGDALAAVNGGYFAFSPDWGGTTGRPAGLFVDEGALISEGIDGRPALVIRDGRSEVIEDVETRITVTMGGEGVRADGINRRPGRTINCGNPGDVQGEGAAHDALCDDPDELIVFDEGFGATSGEGEGEGAEVVVVDGAVTERREARGGPIPEGGMTLQGIGAMAERLSGLAVGDPVEVAIEVTAGGAPVDLAGAEMVGGGPTLLSDALMPPVSQRAREGWSRTFGEEDRAGFYYGWVLRRHPRTAAGVSEDGRVLTLVTVDGRQPGVSVGATITEMARVMDALGARDALNLDGGGSTTMVIDGAFQTGGSDAEPRAVSDAIVVRAAR